MVINLYLNAAISGLLAGLVSIAISSAIEKLGGRIGGVLGTTPTIIIPAMIGIYLQFQQHDKYVQAAFAIPIGSFTNSLFLLSWKVIPKHLPIKKTSTKLIIMLIISISIWFVFSGSFMFLKRLLLDKYSFDIRYFGLIFFLLHLLLGIFLILFQNTPAPKGKNKPTLLMIISRGLLAGVAVATGIIVSHFSDPSIGSVVAIFPAIFITAMVTVWISQGESVALGATGPLIMGMISVPTFSIVSSVFVLKIGLPLGILVTYLLSICVSVLVAGFVTLRQKFADRQYLRLENQPSGANLLSSQPSESLILTDVQSHEMIEKREEKVKTQFDQEKNVNDTYINEEDEQDQIIDSDEQLQENNLSVRLINSK